MSTANMVEQGSSQQPSWIQRNQGRITALAVTVIAAVGVHTALRGSGNKGYNEPAPIEAQFTNPIPLVMNYNHTEAEFQQSMDTDYQLDDDYAAGVKPPSARSTSNFASYYANNEGLPASDPPRLREVVFMDDAKAFSGEVADNPGYWPFTVYNAINDPVDVEFMRYSAVAIRAWQTQQGHKPLQLYDGTVQARIEPILTPHVMIQTPTMPPQLHDSSGDGMTVRQPGVTVSWIRPQVSAKETDPTDVAVAAFKNSGEFASRETIATEMCQAFVDVYDVKPLIGGDDVADTMRQYASTFNAPAMHNLDLAAQENVCNALGRVIAAIYVDGTRGVGSLLAHQSLHGLEQIDPFDYGPYMDSLGLFSRISEGVKQNPSVIETTTDPSTPTARYYVAAADQP